MDWPSRSAEHPSLEQARQTQQRECLTSEERGTLHRLGPGIRGIWRLPWLLRTENASASKSKDYRAVGEYLGDDKRMAVLTIVEVTLCS